MIFDNLTSALFDYEVAIKELRDSLRDYWDGTDFEGSRFNVLIVESKNELLFFEKSGFQKLEILNLW